MRVVQGRAVWGVLIGAVLAAGCQGYSVPRAVYPVDVIAVDTIGGTVTLPLHRGRVRDKLVWYIVTESSDRADAARRGVTWAPRMASLATSSAVQPASESKDGITFNAGVDFTPEWAVRGNPDSGFPPAEARPGSVGEPGYSPFVRLQNGVVLNAPIIGDERHVIDRVVLLHTGRAEAVLRITRGYAPGRDVWYITTDASDAGVAAMERSTWVPRLAEAPAPGASGATTSRFALLAITNGATGRTNPERQGLASALLDGLSPLTALQGAPDPRANSQEYTPLWDLHLASWTPAAIDAGQRVKIFSFAEAKVYAERGWIVSAMPGTANPILGGITALNVVVNCPVMASFARERSP